MEKINKKWFKNRLKKGELEFICKERLTDDYAFDAANNFFASKKWAKATESRFSEWFINASVLWGDKAGTINLSFANSEIYEFRTIKL